MFANECASATICSPAFALKEASATVKHANDFTNDLM
jgi:hypothetical protein